MRASGGEQLITPATELVTRAEGDQSLLDPAREIRAALRDTRRGTEQDTRDFCLRKLEETAGENLVIELADALVSFTREAMRSEFSVFKN